MMKMKLSEKVLAGDVQTAARLMKDVENELPSALEELDAIYPHTGRASVVGFTGAPGVGKSTLIDALIGAFRKKKLTVGVIAVDPTSPFTGGAILGDRIRMQQRNIDRDVFIRSMATRGWRGGLSKSTISMIHIMDAMGKDIIMVETVGSGQSEIDITKVADTTLLILSPGSGSEVQMMKAGILEAADIFAINKADKEGVDNVASGVRLMLGMRTSYQSSEWKPDIILTEAISGKGVEELSEVILKHKECLISTGELEKRRKEKAREELIGAIESFVKNYCYQGIDEDADLEELVDSITQKKTSPHSAALKLISQVSRHFKQAATK